MFNEYNFLYASRLSFTAYLHNFANVKEETGSANIFDKRDYTSPTAGNFPRLCNRPSDDALFSCSLFDDAGVTACDVYTCSCSRDCVRRSAVHNARVLLASRAAKSVFHQRATKSLVFRVSGRGGKGGGRGRRSRDYKI